MKKLTVAISAVAASVLMAMSAQAAEIYNKDSNKLDLYGKVNAKHYFSSNDADDGDTTYARLGFKGETQINDQLTGFGQWEYEFKGNRAESQGSSKDKTRLAFAGLKFGDYGSIDYGRNYGVAYDIGAWTDVLPEFGGDTWTQTDVFMTGRTTGVATYRNNDFFGLVDGLNFAAQYQAKTIVAISITTLKVTVMASVSLLPMNTKDSVSVQLMRNLIVPTLKLMQGKFFLKYLLPVKMQKFGPQV